MRIRNQISPTAALTLGLWGACYVGAVTTNFVAGRPDALLAAVKFILVVTMGAGLCLAMGWLFERGPKSPAVLRWLYTVVCVIFVALAWAAPAYWIMIRSTPTSLHIHDTALQYTFVFFMTRLWTFAAWACGWFAIRYGDRLADRRLRLAQAEASAAGARDSMLRYQLNPHFLFNSLNALSALILEEDFIRAEGVLKNLQKFLRTTLSRSSLENVTLREEVEVQKQYLRIERARFEDRLSVSVKISDTAAECLVPSLILQPLVENAIKFGVMPARRTVHVSIDASVTDRRLRLRVCNDDGDAAGPAAMPGLGVGLENVRRRLALLYDGDARLSAGRRAEGGYQAVLDLPALAATGA